MAKAKKAKADAAARKKKAKAREVEEEELDEADDEDELDDELDDAEDDDSPKKKRARNDVYVGLGAITLLALILAAVFFYYDAEAAGKKPLPQANFSLSALAAAPAR